MSQHSFGAKLRGQRSKRLSLRELEVLDCLSSTGATDAEIALRLGIVEQTVRHHLHSIFRKLGVTNRTALVALSLRSRKDGILVEELLEISLLLRDARKLLAMLADRIK